MAQFVVFSHPDNGYDRDHRDNEACGLVVSERYELTEVHVGSWHTNIVLRLSNSEEAVGLNEACFDFFDANGEQFDPIEVVREFPGYGYRKTIDGVLYERLF